MVTGLGSAAAAEELEEQRELADGVLKPGGVVVVVGGGGVGAAHFGGDGVVGAEADAVGPVVDPQLKGQALLRPAAEGAGDPGPGGSGHFRSQDAGDPPPRADPGSGLAVVEAQAALGGDAELQGERFARFLGPGPRENDAVHRAGFIFSYQRGRDVHKRFLSMGSPLQGRLVSARARAVGGGALDAPNRRSDT